MTAKLDETRIAELIVGVLPASVARALSWDPETIHYSVRSAGLKLRTITLSRDSLRRLIDDPVREIKIEYLQRDLIRNSGTRADFRYPRPHLTPATAKLRKFRLSLTIASMV